MPLRLLLSACMDARAKAGALAPGRLHGWRRVGAFGSHNIAGRPGAKLSPECAALYRLKTTGKSYRDYYRFRGDRFTRETGSRITRNPGTGLRAGRGPDYVWTTGLLQRLIHGARGRITRTVAPAWVGPDYAQRPTGERSPFPPRGTHGPPQAWPDYAHGCAAARWVQLRAPDGPRPAGSEGAWWAGLRAPAGAVAPAHDSHYGNDHAQE